MWHSMLGVRNDDDAAAELLATSLGLDEIGDELSRYVSFLADAPGDVGSRVRAAKLLIEDAAVDLDVVRSWIASPEAR